MAGTKLTLEINNKSLGAGMMTSAYLPERFGIKRSGNNTIIDFTLMFIIKRDSDNKLRLRIKCEGSFEIEKKYENIKEQDIYSQFKKGADHIADWIIENEVTEVRPVFPSIDKLSSYIKKLLDNPDPEK